MVAKMWNKKLTIDHIYEVCAPIFTPEMGGRFRMMREALLLTQGQLSEQLGIPQQTISKLERGILQTPESPVSVAKLKEIFGDRLSHILIGTGEDRFNYALIHSKYLKKTQKKRGFGTKKYYQKPMSRR